MSSIPIKVLHVLANSRPDLNGYAVRTHDLLIAQLNTGKIQPIGITSPFYPERESMVDDSQIDNILYIRCPHPLHHESYNYFGATWLRKRARLRVKKPQQKEAIQELAEHQEKIDVIVEVKSEQINPDEPQLETTKMKIKSTVFRAIRLIRKLIGSGYRFTYRMIRRILRFGIRITRKSIRFFRRNIRKFSRPIRKAIRPFPMWIEERILMKKMEKSIIETVLKNDVEIIHAHTPYRVGIPAMRAAKKLKIPFVYEMRGMWEDTAVANGRWKTTSLAYRRYRSMETKVLKTANHVICISKTLKNEAISRGVKSENIHVVQNAVNPDKIRNEPSNLYAPSTDDKEHLSDTISKLNITSKTCVIGYIGSLRELEGVDDTATAVAKLNNEGHDVRLLVLSGLSNQDSLRNHCEKLNLGDLAVITGPVPHERVPEYYKLIDVFVVSRPDTRVTRLVTPLKPFEAMVMERAVICSDLPALAEIIDDGNTGRLYPAGDLDKLAITIRDLAEDKSERQRLGNSAKKWVESERTWSAVTRPIPELYRKLINHSGR